MSEKESYKKILGNDIIHDREKKLKRILNE